MKKKVLIGIGAVLVFGFLLFLAYKETEYSRQFVTEYDNRAILW